MSKRWTWESISRGVMVGGGVVDVVGSMALAALKRGGGAVTNEYVGKYGNGTSTVLLKCWSRKSRSCILPRYLSEPDFCYTHTSPPRLCRWMSILDPVLVHHSISHSFTSHFPTLGRPNIEQGGRVDG